MECFYNAVTAPYDLFEVRRAHIELFARWLEGTGRAKSTVARRLSTITGFYRFVPKSN